MLLFNVLLILINKVKNFTSFIRTAKRSSSFNATPLLYFLKFSTRESLSCANDALTSCFNFFFFFFFFSIINIL